MSEQAFQADSKIAQIAEAYSQDAIATAQNFGTTLDWSESSIQQVEQMLGRLHAELNVAKPSPDTIWNFAKALGSYVGEVIRRHHGGEWGMVSMNGQTFPGMRQSDGSLIWPWGKVHNRLTNGPEDNVWHYYQALTRTAGNSSPHLEVDRSEGKSSNAIRKPWWKFW